MARTTSPKPRRLHPGHAGALLFPAPNLPGTARTALPEPPVSTSDPKHPPFAMFVYLCLSRLSCQRVSLQGCHTAPVATHGQAPSRTRIAHSLTHIMHGDTGLPALVTHDRGSMTPHKTRPFCERHYHVFSASCRCSCNESTKPLSTLHTSRVAVPPAAHQATHANWLQAHLASSASRLGHEHRITSSLR
jgi:hypothetical protein